MVEGTVRHPVTGTPQGGIISPLLANVYLSAIDERYGRWSTAPRERPQNATDRRYYDRRCGRPTFQMVRYADDFVILVSGSKEEAEVEKDALARFLKQELRMELSMEKTLITEVEAGFEFLGYRVVQTRARLTGRLVGNLFIPKGKLQRLRDTIKAQTTRSNLNKSLARLINELNPKILGWRNYYRYATRACHEFHKLDWWLGGRILRWLQKKHRKAQRWKLQERYRVGPDQQYRRWGDGAAQLRSFREGGTDHFPDRGIRIPNGWNADPKERFQHGAPDFWKSVNATSAVR